MIKTLLKKQLYEFFAVMFMRGGTKKKKSNKGMMALYAFLFIYVIAVFGMMFFGSSFMIFQAFSPMGLDWLCFALMGLMGTFLAIIGSVFITNSMVYDAKDNELLLSMPIRPAHILFVRIFVLYLSDLFYEALVLVPCFIAYAIVIRVTVLAVVNFIILLFVMPLFALALSCILGWGVALISSRIKNKSFMSVICSVAFIAIYYYFFMKIQNSITELIANGDVIGESIKNFVYPVYAMGKAATGDLLSLLVVTLCIGAIFALVYFVLSKSFIKIVTTKRGGTKAKYKEKAHRAMSAEKALLHKEFGRFWNSSAYILNCGFGSLFMLIAAVAVAVKGRDIAAYLTDIPEIAKIVPLIICLAIGFMSTMNMVSAPSISLEAKTLWILRSLPISAWSVLKQKVVLHMAISAIPAVVCAISAGVVFYDGVASFFLICVFALLMNLLVGVWGLGINLKFPNFTWTNETIPIKQGASTILTMLAGWGMMFFFVILYVLVRKFVAPVIFLLCVALVMAIAATLSLMWLKKRGTKIFETL